MPTCADAVCPRAEPEPDPWGTPRPPERDRLQDPPTKFLPVGGVRGVSAGVAEDYVELVGLLRRRRQDLGLTQLEVDHLAGFQDGYCGKLEVEARRATGPTLGWWAGALGVGLVLVELRRPRRRGRGVGG